MGIAKLNIWLTETDKPCKIFDRTFWVSIFTCDGQILSWADKEYKLLEAENGHLEIEVPPGCYYIRAASIHCENAYSDSAVVRVGCGDKACVTLMLPSLRRCVDLVVAGLRHPIARERVPAELINPAVTALNEVAQRLGTPVYEYELAHMEETMKRLTRREKE